ncbi:unnamed protein product [Trichobilharzia regenti]|nr:unnamed protein product [Trichobilharzia regenti]
MSEDCLYLNIWTRANSNNFTHDDLDAATFGAGEYNPLMLESSAVFGPKGGRPVMVWIHGGSLIRGSASLELYNGAILAGKMNVVVVSIQYRLGPLGFLYLGDNEVPGNQGLMDQVAAFQWIRENIAYFGGNPQHSHTALEKTRLLAHLSGCKVASGANGGNSRDLVDCLRSVDSETLVVNQWHMHLLRNGENSSRTIQLRRLYQNRASHHFHSCEICHLLTDNIVKFEDVPLRLSKEVKNKHLLSTAGYYFDVPFKPVITAPFLPEWPYEVLGSGKLNIRHRIMLGVNKDEGKHSVLLFAF